MIEPRVIRCDGPGCGRVKAAGNHWFVLNMISDGPRTFYAIHWKRAPELEIAQGKHACSRQCAQKLFEQWMTEEG